MTAADDARPDVDAIRAHSYRLGYEQGLRVAKRAAEIAAERAPAPTNRSATQVTAAFITPTCRVNKGDEGAWDEAVDRLREQYEAIVAAWAGRPQQPTLNLILTMERP